MDQVCKEALQPDARVRQRSACDIELILDAHEVTHNAPQVQKILHRLSIEVHLWHQSFQAIHYDGAKGELCHDEVLLIDGDLNAAVRTWLTNFRGQSDLTLS